MMFNVDPERIKGIHRFYETRDRWTDILKFRELREQVGSVKNLFYGDSITDVWPLHEFFPNHSILNRGIGGDNTHGLYSRLENDVFAYSPKRVFMLVGINEIWDEQENITGHIKALAEMMQEKGIKVFLSSILPLREVEGNERFKFQDKVITINAELHEWAGTNDCGFLDYHSALLDKDGQFAAEYARPDGLHVEFAGYRVMSDIVRPHLED